jgi:hypothetical protein
LKTAIPGWLSSYFDMPLVQYLLRSTCVLFLLLLIGCGEGRTSIQPHTAYTQANNSNLPLEMTWQIQYSGAMDYSLHVDMFNLDLFDTDEETIGELKQRGIVVVCYFSAGSHEDWRPDSHEFPVETLGNPMRGWEGETWLDIRKIASLRPVLEKRLDLAVSKGCDGVDPDNVNGYENDTGFALTYEDQLAFNIYLANAAHERGLLIGLKNDLGQIEDLLLHFDWALDEECFSYNECELLLPFIEAGKPVFVVEYETKPDEFCEQANRMNFNALHKNWELDAYRAACR